ncbi:MAG: hypothetical protein ACE5JI_12330, partial [Acidobacteriota bacterium]
MIGENEQQGTADWYFRVTRPGRPVYMAAPDFEVRGSAAAESAKLLSKVVWNDLEFASIYRIVQKRLYRLAGKAIPSAIDYYQWESIGTDILILGAAEIQGEKLVSEVRIYAVQAQQMVFGKRYEGSLRSARDMAHKISDDIL